MDIEAQQQKHRDNVLSSLNAAIEALNLVGGISDIIPAKALFGTVSVILAMIRDSIITQADYVELGLACADVCIALDGGLKGKKLSDINDTVLEATDRLRTTVAEIQRKVIKEGKRSAVSRIFHAKNDKEKIAAWRVNLNRILLVFNTELAINIYTIVSDVHRGVENTHCLVSGVGHDVVNTYSLVSDVRHEVKNTQAIVSELNCNVVNTHTIVSDIHRNMLKREGGADGQQRVTQNSIPGESPPPPPRAFFGRDELIEKIVGLAEDLIPIALIGAGGIGKTSIALTVLHDNRIKQRFGDNRRFIRCDQFPPSPAHFLRRLSKVIDAGIENPEDLSPLRPYLSSNAMFIILDNAESVLDPQGTGAQGIYPVLEELSQFGNICICITSRISTVPPHCEILDIPTLSVEAGRDTFYRIYKHGERSDLIGDILEQLDFHPLSITLLATVAQYNKWDADRLTREWERRRTGVLDARHNKSLAATIEVSLSSPTFRELGPDARELLGVIAFFPQGINETNLDWLFPTISDGASIFDTFCVLSLTYRSNGFITMLAPLRDHLCPKDPMSSHLFCIAKECYFTRLSVDLHPDRPGFGEARWITLEDTNIEYLLDILTTIDANSESVWGACAGFMRHLYWHKPRLAVLQSKIEGLPGDHRSKPECLFELSRLFASVRNYMECERLLTHALRLWRGRGDVHQVARTLSHLSDANRGIGRRKEGARQAKEALEIYEQLGDTVGQAQCWEDLAWVLFHDQQASAAQEAASRAIGLLPEKGEQFLACRCHRVLGDVYHLKGERSKASIHLKMALGIAISFNWHNELFWIHFSLAVLSFRRGGFDDAHAQIERAKSHVADNAYLLGRAAYIQADFWHQQRRHKRAKSEVLRATGVFEKLGATDLAEGCRQFLQTIEKEINSSAASYESDDDEQVTESESEGWHRPRSIRTRPPTGH